MPMVSMTMENAGWPRMGRITTRFSSHADQRHGRHRWRGTASQNGKPSMRHQARPQEGAQHHQLALGEADGLGGPPAATQSAPLMATQTAPPGWG
jgi:hypothetical protein